MWETILDLIGGGGDWLTNLVGGGGEAAAGAAGAAGSLSDVPWGQILGQGLGLAGQGLGIAGQMGAFGGGQETPNFPMPGMQAQQSAGVSPQMMRRRMADAQSQGLSGASPDFLATLAGVTPEELNQMMGLSYAYDGSSGQQGQQRQA